MTQSFSLSGETAENVYSKLIDKGISKADASRFVADWIIHLGGAAQRTFTYTQPVGASDPGCKRSFQQSFHHLDWTDGVSVVQAGKTTGEDGFNDRLHRIEDDLAALGRDFDTVFKCIGDLRAAVAEAFDEVKTELNRIDKDIWDLQRLADQVGGRSGGTINTGDFIGVSDFLGKKVTIWRTEQGFLTLPAVQSLGGDGAIDPQVDAAGKLSQLIHTTPEITQAYGAGPVTVQDIVSKFGDKTIGDGGPTLKDMLTILPADAHYNSLDDMISAAAERSATVIKATNSTDAAVATSFTDLGSGITKVSEAPVERMNALPTDAREALVNAGIKTVGDLANANAADLSKKMQAAGVAASTADAAAWKGTAMTLSNLGR